MTTLILRRIKDHLVLTGPDIEPMQFKTRPEARDWCRSRLSWGASDMKSEREGP